LPGSFSMVLTLKMWKKKLQRTISATTWLLSTELITAKPSRSMDEINHQSTLKASQGVVAVTTHLPKVISFQEL